MIPLTAGERAAIAAAIAGAPDEAALSAQLASAEVTEREWSGVGCFVHLRVAAGAPPARRARGDVRGAGLVTARLDEVDCAAVVFVAGGRLTMLEFASLSGPVEVGAQVGAIRTEPRRS